MAGIDDDPVGQVHVEILRRAKQRLGQFFGLVVAEKVRATHRLDEEGIAAQDAPRISVVLLEKQEGDMLGSVPRRITHRKLNVAKADVAVADRVMVEPIMRILLDTDAEVRDATEPRDEFPRAR